MSCNSSDEESFQFQGDVRATGTWTPGVLGQGYGSPGVPRKLMNSFNTLTSSGSGNSPFSTGSTTRLNTYGGTLLGGSLKTIPTCIPKTPRPNKARSALDALSEGLKACIQFAEEEIAGYKEGVREMSISNNQSMLQGRIYEMEKTVKATERTLKKLEYQLSLVEELGEQYNLQQRLREGVRAMAYAFSISEGRERDAALANVKAGFKECTEVLCNLEGQLESFLGSFKMSMKGIQGFARLCPGDVFEITIKHGHQKWKTRGKIGKDGSQSWDFPRATFRVVLGEVLYIKAAEVKTLGKQILLGNKFCEATELFSAHPQLMTVNLNPSGSLKLNVVVTWRPLEVLPEQDLLMITGPGSASPSRKRRLSPQTSDLSLSSTHLAEMESPSMMGTLSSRSAPAPLWARTLESIDDNAECASFRFSSLTGSKTPRMQDGDNNESFGDHGPETLACDPSGNFSLRKRDSSSERQESLPRDVDVTVMVVPTSSGRKNSVAQSSTSSNSTMPRMSNKTQENRNSEYNVEQWHDDEDNEDGVTSSTNGQMLVMEDEENVENLKSLRDSILKLITFLEDIKGQWPELENLEVRLGQLERMITDGPSVRTSSSSSSLNIESALECFDFLDSVVVEEGSDNCGSPASPPPPIHPPDLSNNRIFNVSERYTRHRPTTEIMDPKMTARTTDSGISSLGGHTHSRSPSPARSADSPSMPLVTGNAQLDIALETHIHLCLLLVQNLGSYGPLKSREREAVSKLIQQGCILGEIINISRILKKNPAARVVDLSGFPVLQTLWERITDVRGAHCPVVTTADMAVNGLEMEIRPILHAKFPGERQISHHVAKIMTSSMLDTGADSQFSASAVLTVFQFQYFLAPHHDRFSVFVQKIAEEELLQSSLDGEGHEVIGLLKALGGNLPPKKVVTSLIRWCISPNKEAARIVKEYFRDLSCLHSNRYELVHICLEMMESDWNVDRESACYLLSILEASDTTEQLAYVAQSDPAPQVRSRAKESLLSLGQDRIIEQLTLSTHGFQGLAVN